MTVNKKWKVKFRLAVVEEPRKDGFYSLYLYAPQQD